MTIFNSPFSLYGVKDHYYPSLSNDGLTIRFNTSTCLPLIKHCTLQIWMLLSFLFHTVAIWGY